MKRIQIIPIEKTYLRVFEKPPKVRLTRQVITFNYGALSPYPGGGHLSCQTATGIFVWYLKNPLTAGMTIQIPEGYLVWRFFKDRTNALVLIVRQGVLSVMVIQNGTLRAQVTRAADEGEAQTLDLLQREYSLQNAEIIRLSPTVTFNVKLHDMITFADVQLKPSNLLEQCVALLKAPLIAMLLITSGFYIYQENRLESYYADKTKYLARLKRENADLQSSLEDVREKTAYWRDFIAKEQIYPDYYQILSGLTDVVKRHGGYLNMVEYNENRLTVWTGIKSSEASIIKELLATGVFQEVKLLASTKDSFKPDFNLYNLSIILRPLSPDVPAKVKS
ncbi:MAG: hypothetical protein WCP20_06215 [Desulfuromonadales bacterium]